jgi:hypothetical protein
MWAADLASGETLICRAIKAATIAKYLGDAARFIAGYTGCDPRFMHRGDQRLHPMIQGVLDEVIRYEKVPDKREPHTPKMQAWLRDHAVHQDEDSLSPAMADWGALGLVLGPRISEWAQEAGNDDPHSPRLAPDSDTYAFTWKDVEARREGNRRVNLTEAIRLPDEDIHAITVTFTWQKNGNHGEKRLLVPNHASPDLCPVRNMLRILRRFARLLGTENRFTPLSVYRQEASRIIQLITAREVTSYLRRAAQQVYDLDPSTPHGASALQRWSSHSLRVGACVILHLSGLPAEKIKFLLRWSSDAFQQYLRNLGALSAQQNEALTLTDTTMPTLM